MVILFSTKCFLFVYMYIDLLKLKAYKLFENSAADLSWLLFSRSQLESGEFKRQTASEIAILRNNSDTQSVSSWVYKETEIKI